MKKRGLNHSQIGGIIWITAVLTVILLIVFFSKSMPSAPITHDTVFTQKVSALEKKEDSAYRSRRPKRPYRIQPSHSQHYTSIPDSLDRSVERPRTPIRQPLKVELNSADSTTLQLLHGIGPVYARRIVRYRERLGGFTSTDQLLEVYGFTPELLDHLAPYLLLDTSNLHRINVNSVGLKQFIKHPYVEYYFARDLVNLRSRGVTFSSPDDLRALPSCNDTLLARLLPYLEF